MSEWQPAQLSAYVSTAMHNRGIKNDAELARLAGIKQTQISTLRTGKARPSIPTLDKLAVPLRVPPRELYVLAGHMTAFANEVLDLTALPSEIRNLIDLYKSMTTDAGRRQVREQIDFAVSGLRARLTDPGESPESDRRRAS